MEVIYILGGILIFIIVIIYLDNKTLRYIKYDINKKWGKIQNIRENKINFKYTASYFNNRKDNMKFFIDDITWNDLNMDDVFKSMNNTQTSIGDEMLYSILREPLFEDNELKRRNTLIEYLRDNSKHRFDIQYALGKIGKKKSACLSDYLYNKKVNLSNKLTYYRILSVLPIVFLVLGFINNIFFLFILISIILNIYIHQSLNKKNGNILEDYSYLVSIINCAKEIYRLNIVDVNKYYVSLEKSLNNLKEIKNSFIKVTYSSMNEVMLLNEYLNLFFLKEVKLYEKINRKLIKNNTDFRNIYKYIGELDSFIAVASYREALSNYCNPILKHELEDKNGNIRFKNIYHPLIKNPIKNSYNLNNSLLITGSNASGKSTFLRTIAINSILAQTIYTVFAEEYESSYFRLYTSMALKDDIFSNESYYMVESKSLKRILDSLDEDVPILCFIDEILRGTNTIERIAASSEILKYFSEEKCICVAATHDIELTYILQEKFTNCHFQEDIKDNNIVFDYKLYKGRSKTRNAIKILSIIGYDEGIVKRAERRAENFIKNNKWE